MPAPFRYMPIRKSPEVTTDTSNVVRYAVPSPTPAAEAIKTVPGVFAVAPTSFQIVVVPVSLMEYASPTTKLPALTVTFAIEPVKVVGVTLIIGSTKVPLGVQDKLPVPSVSST